MLDASVAFRLQFDCGRNPRNGDLFPLAALRDGQAKARIAARLRRLAFGNPGDVKPVGEGVSELRIPYGPGYRVYFVQRGSLLIVLLCGGDKKTQKRDIETAKQLAKEIE